MKTITVEKYVCDTCSQIYDEKQNAINCEDRHEVKKSIAKKQEDCVHEWQYYLDSCDDDVLTRWCEKCGLREFKRLVNIDLSPIWESAK